MEGAACYRTSFAGVCTLLALSADSGRDDLGSLVDRRVQDRAVCTGLGGAAFGWDNHCVQDNLSGLSYLDILVQGTFGAVGERRHVGFLDPDVVDPLALHDVVHNDLCESPDTFSDPGVFLVQGLHEHPFEHLDVVLKDLVLTGLGVVVLHSGLEEVGHLLLTDHIVLSWLGHSAGPAYQAFLVFVVHSQLEEDLCSDLAPCVSGPACSVLLVLLLVPVELADLAQFLSAAVSDIPH